MADLFASMAGNSEAWRGSTTNVLLQIAFAAKGRVLSGTIDADYTRV
jgi:hypothetical protein